MYTGPSPQSKHQPVYIYIYILYIYIYIELERIYSDDVLIFYREAAEADIEREEHGGFIGIGWNTIVYLVRIRAHSGICQVPTR